jgi:fibronectin type III domain protein
MSKAKRGFGARRVVVACLIGNLAIALAGCGGDGGTGAAGVSTASETSASSTTPRPGADTTTGSTNAGGSTTTTDAATPTTTPPKAAVKSSITLGWVPPTENSDGSPITNLAGFKIHYGMTSSEYTQTIALGNAGLTRYVVDSLPSGTYYFAITAYNAQGIESPLSGEISTTVD